MERKLFKIYNMRAVGMHHWGPKHLVVNDFYTLHWEPDCPYDIANAMAIHDSHGEKRAYITRADARILSLIWVQGLNVAELMTLLPVTEAHVECHDLGPQHECTVAFKALGKDIARAQRILETHRCTFECR
jgi:hypothetical protein